jgi:hypothetical protein
VEEEEVSPVLVEEVGRVDRPLIGNTFTSSAASHLTILTTARIGSPWSWMWLFRVMDIRGIPILKGLHHDYRLSA